MAKLLERRRSERFEVNSEFAELEPGSISFVNNLSEQGVFISTRTRLPLGTLDHGNVCSVSEGSGVHCLSAQVPLIRSISA